MAARHPTGRTTRRGCSHLPLKKSRLRRYPSWDAATDKQFVAGREWCFTGNTPGTVTEATPEEAEAILGPHNDAKASASH